MDRKDFINKILLSASGTLLALNAGHAQSIHEDQVRNIVKVGFAKSSLVPVIKSTTGFRRNLESRCAVIKDNLTRIAIVALDLIEITPQTNLFLQNRISQLTGFPAGCILLHTTHTHASPWDSRENNSMIGLGDEIAKTIIDADSLAVPATIKTGNRDVGGSLSLQRIGYAGDELGYQSFWYGYQYREGENRPDASALVNEMKSRWLGKEPNYKAGAEPIWFDRPVDPLVQTMAFEDLQGKSIGTIVRFSAHVGPTDYCESRLFDPDFPAVVRDCMEEKMGGTSMYMSGPLGNLAPKVKLDYVIDKNRELPESYLGPTWALIAKDEKKALAERDRIGKEIAVAALESIKVQKPEEISAFRFQTKMHELSLDPNLPKSKEDIEMAKKMLIPEYHAFKKLGKNTRELRLLANRMNWLEWTGQFVDLITADDRKAGYTKLPLSTLKINNTVLAFTHSETVAESSIELRGAFPSLNMITVCLTGGTVQYIPSSKIIDMGGYEGRATVIHRNAEEKLREEIGFMINNLL